MSELDILNYPGSKLGSLTNVAPSVLKSSSPKTPATSDLMAKIGGTPTPGGFIGPKETLASDQELSDQKGAATEALGKADIGIERAKQQQKASELEIDAQSKQELVQSLRKLPEKTALDQGREKLKNNAFVPTKDTVQDIAGLFSLINVIGMAIGGGGKRNAQMAMYAMNGMAEGYQKGKTDLYRKEQIEFDKNFKAMQAAVQTLEKEYSEAVELEKTDKEAGRIARQVALARQTSPVLKAMEDRLGPAKTLETIKDLVKSKDTAVDKFNSLKKIQDDKVLAERKMTQQVEELVIDESNFSQYFRPVSKSKPQKDDIIATYRAKAKFVEGDVKKNVIGLLQIDENVNSAVKVMQKLAGAPYAEAIRVLKEISQDYLSGMSFEEIEKKEYDYVVEFYYYCKREYIPKDDPHWSTISIQNVEDFSKIEEKIAEDV